MSKRSVSSFLIGNSVNIFAVVMMVLIFADFFFTPKLTIGPYGFTTLVVTSFSNGAFWIQFMTIATLLMALISEIRDRVKWWWHNLFLFGALIIGIIWYNVDPKTYNVAFLVFAAGMCGAISVAGFSFGASLMKKITISSAMSAWILIMAIIGIIPLTPIADVVGPAVTNFCYWMFQAGATGPMAVFGFVMIIGNIAFFVRVLLLIEKLKPRLVSG